LDLLPLNVGRAVRDETEREALLQLLQHELAVLE
jgi:hypothetical protein